MPQDRRNNSDDASRCGGSVAVELIKSVFCFPFVTFADQARGKTGVDFLTDFQTSIFLSPGPFFVNDLESV
jgi:hypothetical protein